MTWGLEAETTGGYCLPSAQLAVSGIMVVNAVYDTLITLNDKSQRPVPREVGHAELDVRRVDDQAPPRCEVPER